MSHDSVEQYGIHVTVGGLRYFTPSLGHSVRQHPEELQVREFSVTLETF